MKKSLFVFLFFSLFSSVMAGAFSRGFLTGYIGSSIGKSRRRKIKHEYNMMTVDTALFKSEQILGKTPYPKCYEVSTPIKKAPPPTIIVLLLFSFISLGMGCCINDCINGTDEDREEIAGMLCGSIIGSRTFRRDDY